MKRTNTIFFVFASLFMLYTFSSCSQKEIIEYNNSEAIAFSPAIGASTKATPTTTSNIQRFTVEAFNLTNSVGAKSFDNQ